MEPLGPWTQRSTAPLAVVRGRVDLWLLGFRPRRQKPLKVPTPTPTREHIFVNIATDAVEMDLRSEFPGDPLLVSAGRVTRHSSLGGRTFDPAEVRAKKMQRAARACEIPRVSPSFGPSSGAPWRPSQASS